MLTSGAAGKYIKTKENRIQKREAIWEGFSEKKNPIQLDFLSQFGETKRMITSSIFWAEGKAAEGISRVRWNATINQTSWKRESIQIKALIYIILSCLALLPCLAQQVASSPLLLFLIQQYLSENMILGTKMLLSCLSYIRTLYDTSNIFGGVGVTPGETKYLQNVTQIPLGDKYFYRLPCSTGTWTIFSVISVTFLHQIEGDTELW